MQKPRKIPQRQCVGCRTMTDKRELVRIVKTPEGEIVLDTTGKKSGPRRVRLPQSGVSAQGAQVPARSSAPSRRRSRRRSMTRWRRRCRDGADFIHAGACPARGERRRR